MVHELLWFLRGDTNVRYLRENGITIWDEWARADGEVGPCYGKQWRKWFTGEDEDEYFHRDQIAEVIHEIKANPTSRRLIVSAWNVRDVPEMALPPCHVLFQFSVRNGRLSCHLYQRSADLFLGVPFNIASYALLTHMVAHVCNLKVGEFIHSFGDLHIYQNHLTQVEEQLMRAYRSLPRLKLDPSITDIDNFRYEHVELLDYDPHPAIKGIVAV